MFSGIIQVAAYVSVCVLSRLLVLPPHGLSRAGLLCPWDFPDKNTGVGRHALLQRIFPTQGSIEPESPALQVDSLPLSHGGSPACASTLFLLPNNK